MKNIFAKQMGSDQFGNIYYESRSCAIRRENNRKRRWVCYNSNPEATKIDNSWFNWLHYRVDFIPNNKYREKSWEKSSKPNSTGSKNAHLPLWLPNSHKAKSYIPWRG